MRPHGAEKLIGAIGWRIRSGDYRIVYRIDDRLGLIVITRVSHQSDVYRRRSFMEVFVQLTEARNRFSEIVRQAQERAVWILRHGHAAAVIVSPKHYEALLDEIEDLRDKLSVYESEVADEDLRIPWEKAKIELGLD